MKGEELARFYNVPVETYYELGRAKVKLRDVLRWSEGSVIKLDRLSGEYIDVFIENQIFAKGEVIIVDEKFSIRLFQILTTEEIMEYSIE
ncbi:MAG TPA: flagellar motor switch protein FliN [Desulfurella acetivorans]|uniref:Flagellar motor switch protein FliN n=1 Tax=Desulfurella acetivorans TaxID=33002 RepID=A0A7C6A6I6_DESAE|nr:flagellar motor switch protein FliN [Desulfurella acetivorans]